jgi:hypothetical protein
MFSKQARGKSGVPTSKVAATFSALLFLVALSHGLLGIDSCQATERGCGLTAQTAFKACNHEGLDDGWIAIGNCINMSDPDAADECIGDIMATLEETERGCKDQREARLEICQELGESPYDPQLDPADFVDPEDIGNSVAPSRYFPLTVGEKRVYVSETEDGMETITVTVTGETKDIVYPLESGQIFKCAVINDVVELDGEVIENTDDWYVQDMEGNVWYFGEIAQNFENGELDNLDGSWKAGKDGAKPGIIMPADPRKGDYYRQEFLLGDAEDMAEVISRGEESVTVPFGTYQDDVLKRRDWTPIEPDVLEFKYYAPGVGMVLELNPENGQRVELVSE